jgi:hypothetical protein
MSRQRKTNNNSNTFQNKTRKKQTGYYKTNIVTEKFYILEATYSVWFVVFFVFQMASLNNMRFHLLTFQRALLVSF